MFQPKSGPGPLSTNIREEVTIYEPMLFAPAGCKGHQHVHEYLLSIKSIGCFNWFKTVANLEGRAAVEAAIEARLPIIPVIAFVMPLPPGVHAPLGLVPGLAAGEAAAGEAVAVGAISVTVATVAVAAALVAIGVAASIQLWQLGKFEAELRDQGFIILEDPQALCTGGCHLPTRAHEAPSFPEFPSILGYS